MKIDVGFVVQVDLGKGTQADWSRALQNACGEVRENPWKAMATAELLNEAEGGEA